MKAKVIKHNSLTTDATVMKLETDLSLFTYVYVQSFMKIGELYGGDWETLTIYSLPMASRMADGH